LRSIKESTALGCCRQELLNQMTDDQGDVLLAALALSAEDDAVSTKSTCDLPVHSYSKRMDSLVTQLCYQLETHRPDLSEHRAAIDYVTNFLFQTMGYCVAEKPLELYSPYRIYMHRVLAQKCGTPEALAIMLTTLLQRSAKAGLLPAFQVEVGIPDPGNRPLLRESGTQDHADADVKCEPFCCNARCPLCCLGCNDLTVYDIMTEINICSLARFTCNECCRWCTPKDCVLACLEYLKRYYWPWEWNVGASESFLTPARAFLGDFGRAGATSERVGVMQITGRYALAVYDTLPYKRCYP
jgi:hypothetical protein